jgi:hypothetical protein
MGGSGRLLLIGADAQGFKAFLDFMNVPPVLGELLPATIRSRSRPWWSCSSPGISVALRPRRAPRRHRRAQAGQALIAAAIADPPQGVDEDEVDDEDEADEDAPRAQRPDP